MKELIFHLFHSLRFRLFAITVGMLFLLGAAMLYSGHQVILQAMAENGRASIRQTSQILNLAIAPAALNNELNILSVYLSELIVDGKGKQGLTYIAVIKEDGTALLTVGNDIVSNDLPPADDFENFDSALKHGLIHIRQPLLLSDNTVGYIQYGLSMELLRHAAEESLEQGGILVALSLLVGTLLIISLGIPFARRIGILIEASEAISQGEYDYIALESGRDEIAQLARCFNTMSKSIRQRILALEEKRAEISLLNKELERRVAKRTHQLENVNNTLEQTIENLKFTQESLIQSEKLASLGSIVAGVAHELNTPIGNALILASTLEQGTHQFTEEIKGGIKRSTLNNYIALIESSCPIISRNLGQAAELISSFKLVAVDQLSSKRREFDLRQVITDVADTLRCSFNNALTPLVIDIPTGINMDSYPGALGQVVTNLINNATIHAFDGSDSGLMRFYAYQESDNRIILEFSDNGCGILPENINRIFDPFFTTRLGQGGSGLGLNIVHNIVEGLLGGQIQVRSELGQGTCFTINLPLHAPNEN